MALKRVIPGRVVPKKSSKKKSLPLKKSVKKSVLKKSTHRAGLKKTSARKKSSSRVTTVKGTLLPKSLFDILCCPMCKSEFSYNKSYTRLICKKCDHGFEIKDGVPVLMPIH